MKFNNKGMTLVELIISIALLSIVLGFLYKVLLDVKYEKDNAGFAASNQINRAEVIRTIEEDFLYLSEKGIYIERYEKDRNVLTLSFSNGNNKSITLSSDKKSITYNAPEGKNKKTWDIADNDYTFGEISVSNLGGGLISITIPVQSNLDNGSKMDDIELIIKGENTVYGVEPTPEPTPEPIEHRHTFNARGRIFIPVYNIESYLNGSPHRVTIRYSCGHESDYGYAIYCSECGMSALYYKYTYNLDYSTTHICPFCASASHIIDDRSLEGTGRVDGSEAELKYDNVRYHSSGLFD